MALHRYWCCNTPIDKPHFPGCAQSPEYQENLRKMTEAKSLPVKESDIRALADSLALPFRQLAEFLGVYENDAPKPKWSLEIGETPPTLGVIRDILNVLKSAGVEYGSLNYVACHQVWDQGGNKFAEPEYVKNLRADLNRYVGEFDRVVQERNRANERVDELELQVGRLKEDREVNERRYQRGKEAERTLSALESRIALFRSQTAHQDNPNAYNPNQCND